MIVLEAVKKGMTFGVFQKDARGWPSQEGATVNVSADTPVSFYSTLVNAPADKLNGDLRWRTLVTSDKVSIPDTFALRRELMRLNAENFVKLLDIRLADGLREQLTTPACDGRN